VFRLLLLAALFGTLAWGVLGAPARDPDTDLPPPPSLTDPMQDCIDRGLDETAIRAKERAVHNLKQTGHRLEEAGDEAHQWLSEKTDDLVQPF